MYIAYLYNLLHSQVVIYMYFEIYLIMSFDSLSFFISVQQIVFPNHTLYRFVIFVNIFLKNLSVSYVYNEKKYCVSYCIVKKYCTVQQGCKGVS